ncbi:MAG: site-specific integrase [Sphingobacteriaceae bacterium]|nr:site-specific integrase [Sphingobacteriaceae bacterium]
MPEFPFKEARLVNSDKPLTARWYIVFWVWDALQNKLIRKRDYQVNSYKTKAERLAWAKTACRELNKALLDGKHINTKKHKEEKNEALVISFRKDYTVFQAFEAIKPIIKATKRIDTYNSYSSVANLFVKFCISQKWDTWHISALQTEDIISFLDYSQTNGIGNTTRNKYLGFIKAMLSAMKDRRMISENPALGIKEEPEDIGKNIAYNDDQIKALKEAILVNNPRLWLFIQFMYYGFIRPAEIGKMQVYMIEVKNGQIVLPAHICKNRKTRYVRIADNFQKAIDELNLHLYRPSDYVFGKNLVSGQIKIQKNYASALHSKFVTSLKLGPDYTFYSWKHTGVVKHYRAGIDIKSIQQQVGHSSLEETNKYLKSLGLLADKSAFDKSPGI